MWNCIFARATCVDFNLHFFCEIKKKHRFNIFKKLFQSSAQPAFTCSNLTIETLKKKSGVALVPLLLTLNKFHTLLECFYC